MRYVINISVILLLILGCDTKKSARKSILTIPFGCEKGEMKPAWYTIGQDEIPPEINNLDSEFIILVATSLQARNFISFHEYYERERSTNDDKAFLSWIYGIDTLPTKQKLERFEQIKKACLITADSLHRINNQGQQQVWIINNSKDTVSIQMQDWSYVCVLEAKTGSGMWLPIQFWQFSFCGNSYYLKDFPPKTANSFITTLPNEGNYKTKLRYKLLGKDKFHYSNEFIGRINHCEFLEDSTKYNRRRGIPQPHYKLDSLINLIWL